MSRKPKRPERPSAIIVGGPCECAGHQLMTTRCDVCHKSYKVHLGTGMTILELAGTRPPIVCIGCWETLIGPVETSGQLIDVAEGRRRLGLDN